MVEAGEAMSDDLVTMLRGAWEEHGIAYCEVLMDQAADEIERLREALTMSHKFAEGWYKRALKAEGHA